MNDQFKIACELHVVLDIVEKNSIIITPINIQLYVSIACFTDKTESTANIRINTNASDIFHVKS